MRIQQTPHQHSRVPDVSQCDALVWLRALPDCSVDLVVTDPPYESLEKHRAIGTTTRLKVSKGSSNKWFKIFPNSLLQELMVELFRILKQNAHAYIFCDQETAFILKPMGEKAGFKFWKPIVWDKLQIGMGYHYRSRYELILFFEKGKRKLNNLGISDIIQNKRIRNGYPTEKPVEVAEVLIRQSASHGEVVCDPFCGSGSFGVAAINNHCQFKGNDISLEAVNLAASRIENAFINKNFAELEKTTKNKKKRKMNAKATK